MRWWARTGSGSNRHGRPSTIIISNATPVSSACVKTERCEHSSAGMSINWAEKHPGPMDWPNLRLVREPTGKQREEDATTMAILPDTSRRTRYFARVETQGKLPFGWWISDVGPCRNRTERSKFNRWESTYKSVQDSNKQISRRNVLSQRTLLDSCVYCFSTMRQLKLMDSHCAN